MGAVQALLSAAGLPQIEPVLVRDANRLATGGTSGGDYFPSRNLLLVTLGAMWAHANGALSIMLGLIRDAASTLPDCSRPYVEALQSVLRLEYPPLSVRAPFLERTKL